jgi:formiminotetrahydrofolate cyclodeaminase
MELADHNLSLGAWLDAAAAKRPTPGGGAVSAVVGALAAAMGEMVVHYSLGKRDLAIFEKDLSEALHRLHRARAMLTELMREDQHAFAALSDARKLPDSAEKSAVLLDATRLCIRVPMAIAATSVSVLHVAAGIVEKSNRWLLSDLVVCAELAMASCRCARVNVRINLDAVPDMQERATLSEEIDQLHLRALRLVQNVVPAIERRQGDPSD